MKDTTRIWKLFREYWSADREEYDDTLTDIITDLRHLSDEYGMDFADSLRRSEYHYEEERNEVANAT